MRLQPHDSRKSLKHTLSDAQTSAKCACVFLSIHTAVIQAVRSVAFQLLNLVAFLLLKRKLNLVKGNPSSLKQGVSIVP